MCPPSLSPSTNSLIGAMLVVDPVKRSSLEQVAAHMWLDSDVPVVSIPQSIPPFSTLEDIPDDIVEVVLARLELGGYGSHSTILE